LETQKKKKLHGEIEMETKLKMKIIPRSTSEALKFLRQVRFLPDFDPDRAAVRSVRRKVIENFAEKKNPVEYSQKKIKKVCLLQGQKNE
jgi:hypothetical protein